MLSPVGEPPSPAAKEIPETLRKASRRLSTFLSFITAWLITVTVLAVSSSG